eukprot:Nk52_evm2s62 gene=Nk52_evmTU2s62
MDLIATAGYSSSEEESSAPRHDSKSTICVADLPASASSAGSHITTGIDSTPAVVIRPEDADSASASMPVDPTAQVLRYNPKYSALSASNIGPEVDSSGLNWKEKQKLGSVGGRPRNLVSGHVEAGVGVSDFHFEEQRKTFNTFGYAVDPSLSAAAVPVGENAEGVGYIGNIDRAKERKGATVFDSDVGEKKKKKKRKREARGDVEDLDNFKGPWAKYEDELTVARPNEDEMAVIELQKENKSNKGNKSSRNGEGEEFKEECTLHISEFRDYQGRTYMHVPNDVGVDLKSPELPRKCFLPKRLIHTWKGHTKAISCFKLFPGSGHLMLSAGKDNLIKLWEVYGRRRCLRTFKGHSKAVKDVDFNCDGSRFVSCGYDRWIKLWDTESGECLGRFKTKGLPYCIKFNPDEDKKHLFLVGCSDKKIYTWDSLTGEVVQEYDRHLDAVNTLTFFDNNLKFASTSDDKSVRIWEWDIPVDAKIIAEPTMHAISAVCLSYNEKWVAGQSSDNKIGIFSVRDKFKLQRKKVFKGHLVAGYACVPGFSPDGNFLISGDSEGKLCIWDFKSTKMYSKFKAHDQVVIGCAWLPHETSKIITCGWDGMLKLWD